MATVINVKKKNTMVTLNERIAIVRKDKKLTQQEFSLCLKVSPSYISQVENGKKKPSIEMLTGINSNFNDIDPDWLLSGNGTMYRGEKQETDKSPKWLTNWWQQSDEAHRNWLEIQLNQTPPVTK